MLGVSSAPAPGPGGERRPHREASGGAPGPRVWAHFIRGGKGLLVGTPEPHPLPTAGRGGGSCPRGTALRKWAPSLASDPQKLARHLRAGPALRARTGREPLASSPPSAQLYHRHLSIRDPLDPPGLLRDAVPAAGGGSRRRARERKGRAGGGSVVPRQGAVGRRRAPRPRRARRPRQPRSGPARLRPRAGSRIPPPFRRRRGKGAAVPACSAPGPLAPPAPQPRERRSPGPAPLRGEGRARRPPRPGASPRPRALPPQPGPQPSGLLPAPSRRQRLPALSARGVRRLLGGQPPPRGGSRLKAPRRFRRNDPLLKGVSLARLVT